MKKTLYFSIYLAALGMLVTLVASVGYNITNPIIVNNRIERIENNIAILYSPDDGYKRNPSQEENAYLQKNYDIILDIYEVLDSTDNIHVLIYNVSAQGRNGMVSALVAVNPYNDVIDAVTFYDHGETPNIGEKYTRDDYINEWLIGKSVSTDVYIDVIADASTTWIAIEAMFNEIETHYDSEEVHIDG